MQGVFNDPNLILDLFEEEMNNDLPYRTQARTRLHNINGHLVYLHLYYTDFYRIQAHGILMSDSREIQCKLKNAIELKAATEKSLAKKSFTVKQAPKRNPQIKPNLHRKEFGWKVFYDKTSPKCGLQIKPNLVAIAIEKYSS